MIRKTPIFQNGKPHISICYGIYSCISKNSLALGSGANAPAAYDSWFKQKQNADVRYQNYYSLFKGIAI